MSKLLDDLIKQDRTDAATYEEFLAQAEALVKRMGQKNTGSHPAVLNSHPASVVIFNNLGSNAATTFQCPADEDAKVNLALEIDLAMREMAPAGWKSDIDGPRGSKVVNVLFQIMSRDRDATQVIFDIVKNQPGYG